MSMYRDIEKGYRFGYIRGQSWLNAKYMHCRAEMRWRCGLACLEFLQPKSVPDRRPEPGSKQKSRNEGSIPNRPGCPVRLIFGRMPPTDSGDQHKDSHELESTQILMPDKGTVPKFVLHRFAEITSPAMFSG
jgi:hypothetical protein